MRRDFHTKNLILMGIDSVGAIFSWVIAIALFSLLAGQGRFMSNLYFVDIVIIAMLCVMIYSVVGIYRTLWQFASIGSVVRLAFATTLLYSVAYLIFAIAYGKVYNIGVMLLANYILLSYSLAIRIYKRIYHALRSSFYKEQKKKDFSKEAPIRTLLLGAGETGAAFLRSKIDGKKERHVVGIIDIDRSLHGYLLNGIPILGGPGMIAELVKTQKVEEIIIAVPTLSNEELKRIIRLTPINKCKVRRFYGISGGMSTEKIRDINMADILGREEHIPDNRKIENWVFEKVVMVTGGGGSIGGELTRQLIQYEISKLILFDISENNAYNLHGELVAHYGSDFSSKIVVRVGSVQDPERLDEVMREFRPNIIFHAAAYKHVPLMEQCPRLALENNTIGSYLTAKAAIKHKVERFVLISTDKAVNPTSVMGATKRLAEIVILGLNYKSATEFMCVRFGNVLESNGSVIPAFRRQIAAGGPVTLTHEEMIRYFMTIPEAAQLVIEAGAMGQGGEKFILDMGSPVKIKDLAENIIRMAGHEPYEDIDIKITGLRPGEKLYEELLLDEDGLKDTENKKIFVVGAREEYEENFDRLEEVLTDYLRVYRKSADTFDVRAMITEFIPEYTRVL